MSQSKAIVCTPIEPPPIEQRVGRGARFAQPGERKSRYTLPDALESGSPVGFRTRVDLTRSEAQVLLDLLSLARPTGFAPGAACTDGELFDEASLGVLSARQSTNFRGHLQISFGPEDAAQIAQILRQLQHHNTPVHDQASQVHVVLCRPYRTPFTGLLTFIGHQPVRSLLSVPKRAWKKWRHHTDDIPTIGYLTDLHIGILADAMERATVLASQGSRRAQVHMQGFSGGALKTNKTVIEPLYTLCGITRKQRREGWRIALVTQVGTALESERIPIEPATACRLGAALLSLRSERIQPGVNQEPKAPAPYQARQSMDVSDELTAMCGRAAYNAMAHWLGVDREHAKKLLLLERIDVLQPGGKRRLRAVRGELGAIADAVVENIPKWADYPTGKALSRNATKGRKAFALAGQRIYLVGASRRELDAAGVDWAFAVRGIGAACARGALVAEIMGSTEIPAGCDLLAGVCLMAGPVNQNDVGKQFYGYRDLLAEAYPDRDPTSLLVWTLKAKTVADPIGNEEQLMNPARKGLLVDLRPAPHEVVFVRRQGQIEPFRAAGSVERAFAEVNNFVKDSEGRSIPGNNGQRWPKRDQALW